MRVLLIADDAGNPAQLEHDPLVAALSGRHDVDVQVVHLDSEQEPADDPDDGDTENGSADHHDGDNGDDGADGDNGAPGLVVAPPVIRTSADDLPGLGADVWVTASADALAGAGRVARRHGTRLVHRVRRLVGDGSTHLEQHFGLLGLADAVVVPTHAAATWLREAAGPSVPEVVVVTPWLGGGPRPRSALEQPLLLAPGPLVAERRPARVLNAFARVADRLPDWRLRFLGGGPLRNEVRAQARRDGLLPRVRVSGPGPDLAAEWARASVAVLAPRVDPFPVDALAAMTAGVPVVALDVPGGTRELVRHGENGLLVPPGSMPGLAAAVLALAEDPALRARLGAGGLATAASYDVAAGVDRWVQVLRGDLPADPPRTPCPELADLPEPAPADPGPDPEPTPQQARTAAMRLVTQAAARTGADWFVLPGSPPRVAVPDTARTDLLAALALGRAPSYLSLRVPAQSAWPERRLPIGAAAAALAGLPATMVVEPWPQDPSGAPRPAGQGCSVEVQLWPVDHDGSLLPPQPNGLVDSVVPPVRTRSRSVEGVTAPVPEALDVRGVHDLDFEIDVVITWVDGADPDWQQRRDARLAAAGRASLAATASGRARYEDHGELRYCLRSVDCFAPWVRRIHLVTAGQVPEWLEADGDRLRVVDHTEILPADALPTFSSRAIETRLHHIDDLAEHFVYLNDDVLLGRPLRPERFFSPAGAPSVFGSQQPIGTPGPARPAYLAAAANNRRLLREAFGVEITQTLAHTPHPHRRSLLQEVEERFAAEVAATTRTPFRSDSDVSMLSSLAQHYGLITGRARVAEPDLTFIGLGAADLARQTRAALRRDQDFVCLADQHDYALAPRRVDALVARFLESYLPVPAPWERAGEVGGSISRAGA